MNSSEVRAGQRVVVKFGRDLYTVNIEIGTVFEHGFDWVVVRLDNLCQPEYVHFHPIDLFLIEE